MIGQTLGVLGAIAGVAIVALFVGAAVEWLALKIGNVGED